MSQVAARGRGECVFEGVATAAARTCGPFSVEPADIVIAPDVTAIDLSEFTRADEMSVIGESATNQQIAQLKTMLSKLDPKLFCAN